MWFQEVSCKLPKEVCYQKSCAAMTSINYKLFYSSTQELHVCLQNKKKKKDVFERGLRSKVDERLELGDSPGLVWWRGRTVGMGHCAQSQSNFKIKRFRLDGRDGRT